MRRIPVLLEAIATVNVQTLLKDGDIFCPRRGSQKTTWNIIGLCKTTLQSLDISYCRGADNENQRRVGFIIHKKIASHITEYVSITNGIASIIIQISNK